MAHGDTQWWSQSKTESVRRRRVDRHLLRGEMYLVAVGQVAPAHAEGAVHHVTPVHGAVGRAVNLPTPNHGSDADQMRERTKEMRKGEKW